MSDYFPSEVIAEILQRLPIKSLAKCMCVCKALKSIITTDSFITSYHHRHLQTHHTNNSSLFFHLFTRFGPIRYFEGFYSLNSEGDILFFWKSRSVRIVGTCNGLVCFSDHYNSVFTHYVIWNPSIHKYVELPNPSLTFQVREGLYRSDRVFCGFGFDSQNNDFKLVRFIAPPCDEATPPTEIYSLASGSWRTITVAAPPFHVDEEGGNKFADGFLHWVAYRTINGMSYNFILTFDIVEEKFGELMLPQCLRESYFDVCILRDGNLLSVIHKKDGTCHEECCEIWVMMEYGVEESWNRLYNFPAICDSVAALRNTGGVVLSDDGIIFRDPINGVEKKLERERDIMFVDHYVESLFLLIERNARTHL